MKKLILAVALQAVCTSAFAQGTLLFNNAGLGFIARVYDTDGTTGLAGSGWAADLYWAAGTVTDSTLLTALNQPATFSTVAAQAGLFFGGPRTIPGAAGGSTITAQVRVWDTASGNSWTTAVLTPNARVGESLLFQVVLADPNAIPPGIPTALTGLSFIYPVAVAPEPSTLALLGLALAAKLILRRACRAP